MSWLTARVLCPPLFSDGTPTTKVLNVLVLPPASGAVCGLLLCVSGPAYWLGSIVCVVGGVTAGREHVAPWTGATRGVAGGLLFAAALLWRTVS